MGQPSKELYKGFRNPWNTRKIDYDNEDEDEFGTYVRRNMAHRAGKDCPYPGSFWSYERHDATFDDYDQDKDQDKDQDYTGLGPKSWRRSDDFILEEANEALYHCSNVDASNIVVDVSNGIVLLSGTVNSRMAKKEAERVVENLPGVWDVHNQLTTETQSKSSFHSSGDFLT